MRVTIMGLGLFGGGVGAARFFAGRGDEVTVTDLASAEDLASSLADLADFPDIHLVLGRHEEKDILDADLVVASPAVPPNLSLLSRRRAAGGQITSEIGLLLERIRGPVLAVTGSNGKTTTTSMLHHLLVERGIRHRVGGNIGGSLLPEVAALDPETLILLELSSFQLETLQLEARPIVGAILCNLSPNHLDRHGDMESYRAAKLRLLDLMTEGAPLILDGDDEGSADWPQEARRRRLEPILVTADQIDATPRPKHLVGRFNRKNLALAAALDRALNGRDSDVVERTAATFRGLPHRLQVLGRIGSLIAINDSKATTPAATAAAVHALDRPPRLIAGGHDKGLAPDDLLEAFESCASVVLFGATAATLAEAFASRRRTDSPSVTRAATLEDAIRKSLEGSKEEGYLLFSPGHPSYDGWANFEQRGEAFAAALGNMPAFEELPEGL